MAAGKINLQANDGSIVGAYVPDGLGSGDRALSFGPNLSGITAYHLLQGNLAVSASTITQGFNTTLYTSGSATTGIDMNTQWGNTAEEKFGGLVWLKDRVEATNNFLYDTVRGATKEINSNTTEAEATLASGLTAFNSTGFTVGADTGHNSTTNNMVSWNFQTTHRITGTTNHGKAYTCHYNPFTGFTIVKYEGSGLAGHEIPHHLGRELGFTIIKNLTTTSNWNVRTSFSNYYLALNYPYAWITDSLISKGNDSIFIASTNQHPNDTLWNNNTSTYIAYGWANSYYDENKLIGNYEIGVYQGTGASGNKVKTRGKPAWIMINRLDSAGNWVIFDNKRTPDQFLSANTSTPEADFSGNHSLFEINGFTLDADSGYINASGSQYLYMVAYDTNSNGGGSYYPLASDTSNLQIQNAIIPFANGVDTNGTKITTLSKNETISGLTLTAGKNYVYSKNDGTYGVSKYKPMYGSLRNRSVAGENPDYFDLKTMKWYGTSGGNELVTNGTFYVDTSGWIAQNGGVLSVVNGTLNIVRGTGNYAVNQTISGLTIGKKYRVYFGTLSNITMFISNNTNTQNYASTSISGSFIDIIPYETSIVIQGHVSSGTGNIDNISVFEAEPTIGSEITTSRNYLNHIVYADNDGSPLYVEELPKIEYKDIIKANEFKGKNACTAWVNFDGTTTPPTIRDSYNVSSVVRTSTGVYDVYFKEPMDTVNYVSCCNQNWINTNIAANTRTAYSTISTLGYTRVKSFYQDTSGNGAVNSTNMAVQIFGGKN